MPEVISNVTPFDPNAAAGPALQKGSMGKGRATDPREDIHRSMPFSDEAEKGVLSCLLQNPIELLNDAQVKIPKEALYHPANRLLFEILLEFNKDNRPIDLVTLSHYLLETKQMDKLGGPATLAELYNFVPTPAHYPYYQAILHDNLLLRKIIGACTESIQNSYEYNEDVPALLDKVEQRVLSIREDLKRNDEKPTFKAMVMAAFDSIEEMLRHPGKLRGITSGYKKLDKLCSGFQGGEMYIIAARPSMGKTSLVMNIVEHAAVENNIPCAVFSLEMSAKLLVQRLIVARAGVSMSRLMGGLLNREELRAVTRSCGELQKSAIFIDETPGLNILDFRAKARRLKKEGNIGLIAIDYLQLMTSDSKKSKDNRQIEISEISAGIKGVAKELDVPIIVLAQLNRQVEQRKGGRPMLSDLRESGSIEQDADLVGLLTRIDYAGSKQEEEPKQDDESRKGEALLIVAKNRNGPTDDVPLRFKAEFMRFEEREFEPHEEQG